MNIKLRYKGTYLGLLWAALEPLFLFLILYVVFTSIRENPKEDFAIYLIVGVMMYHLFARGTTDGLSSLRSNFNILASLNIKKEIFPAIATWATCIFMFVQIGVLFGLMPIFNFIPSSTIMVLPVLLGLFLLLVLGMSYILSILFVYIKDIQPIWNVLIYALLFTSPVFWYVEDASGILIDLLKINPLGQIIEMAHQIVVFGEIPTLYEWSYTSFFVLAIFFGGFFLFHKYEKNVVEKI